MTLNYLMEQWPGSWRSILRSMYANSFVLCLKCGGLPQERFIDAHDSACPGKL
jgi:hypothetical protein